MKSRKLMLLLFVPAMMVVTACSGTGTSSIISSSSSAASSSIVSSSEEIVGKTNDDFEKAALTYTKDGETYDLNMQTLYTNQGSPHLDPLEEQHVMVVPFGFTDEAYESVQTEENIARINTTFFGSQEEIDAVGGWTSIANYYNTSSYGKSTFKGKVLPTWVTYEGTSTEFYRASGGSLGVTAAEYARSWYIKEYAKEGHGDLGEDAEPLTYFDQNGDGYIDLLWVVYSHPTGSTDDWWAYVTYTGNSAKKSSPTVKTLGFASIDWMDNGFNGYDPHTFIHETGHTYGLDDYYDYTSSWCPMGKVDMMDNNIGDQCAFSKFTLGWTSPWVVDETATIKLRPCTTTGDCFIIPSPDYNGTAFDEYFMVELCAPVGLNEVDYKNGYQSITGYSKPGIRITHCDARVYKGDHDSYLSENPEDGVDFRVCNTKFGRAGIKSDGDYYLRDDGDKYSYALVSLMESTVDRETNWTTVSTYNATNDSLFTKGNRFYLSGDNNPWASTFMPSGSNLWNKAKTTTGWVNSSTQRQEVDEDCTFNYTLKVTDIKADDDYGYVATVTVTKNA